MGSGQSLLSVFAPNLRKEKRKRTDQVEKQSKRQRTAVVDAIEDMIQPDAVASGCRKHKRKGRPDDVVMEEESKRTKHNTFDKLEDNVGEGQKIHEAMKCLMSVINFDSRLEDLISNDEVQINEPKCVEYLNNMHDKIVELKRESIKTRKVDWSELPNDLLECILKKLIPTEFDIVGFTSIRDFKAVCQSWRAAAKSCSSKVPLLKTPCLLIHKQTSSLFDPFGNKVHQIRNICDYFPYPRFVGSSYGWVVKLYENEDESKLKVHLFNPITRASIPLPDISGNHTPSRAIISSNPSFKDKFVVVVACGGSLKYYKHGDEDLCWKNLLTDDEEGRGIRVYGEKGFVFHDDLLVVSDAVWNFKEYPPQCSHIKEEAHAKTRIFYLMKSLTGDILRLGKTGGYKRKYETINFSVEKLNLDENKWEILQSLGDQSLFLFSEYNEWELLSLTNPCFLGCEKNSIYFRTREVDKYAVYDLAKGRVKSFGEESVIIRSISEVLHAKLKKGLSKTVWIVPNPW